MLNQNFMGKVLKKKVFFICFTDSSYQYQCKTHRELREKKNCYLAVYLDCIEGNEQNADQRSNLKLQNVK